MRVAGSATIAGLAEKNRSLKERFGKNKPSVKIRTAQIESAFLADHLECICRDGARPVSSLFNSSPLDKTPLTTFYCRMRRGTQVVRERSAKPLYVGSIPTRASTHKS